MVLKRISIVGLVAASLTSSSLAQFNGAMPLAWRWADRIERRPSGAPIVTDKFLYIASGGRMYCLEKASGNEIWRFPLGEPIPAQFVTNAVVVGDTMVAAADNKEIYGVNIKTGEHVFNVQSPANVFARPVSAGNLIVFPLVDNTLWAIESATGIEAWAKPYSNGASILPMLTSWGNNVYFLSGDGRLNAIDARTQAQVWRPRAFAVLNPLSALTSYADTLYVTSGSFITAIQGNSGRIKWEQSVPGKIRFGAAGGPDGVICATDDGRLHTFSDLGRPTSRAGFEVGSQPVERPAFAGRFAAVVTSNGTVKLVDPFSGEIKWSYLIPPIALGLRILQRTGLQTSNVPDAMKDAKPIKSVNAAGPPVVSGTTLLLLAEDGSILAFDRNLGVDLTAPEAKMVWPNSGDQVSGRPPMELVFSAEDVGSGINYDSIQVTINDKPYIHEIDKSDRIRIKILTGSKDNLPIKDGRASILVTVKDWMGNSTTAKFVLSIDNLLPPLGLPKLPEKEDNAPRKGSGLGG